ncbi:MAG: AAA family ATPase [Gammaproteobacteria bacterium]|nr:AAA family ATPase [Gammaproteobacteria bacterium]
MENIRRATITPLALPRLQKLAPRPVRLADTGLTETFVADLLSKHLLQGGVLTMAELTGRLALAGPIVESIINFMRRESRIEVRGPATGDTAASLRYALTERGRAGAQDAMLRGGYVGPAPVPLEAYTEIVRAQTIHDRSVTHQAMQAAYADVVVRDEILGQLGPSLNSGRAIFIYGPPGTGKTYLTQRMARVFPQATLVPHAVAINEAVLEVYDPTLHRSQETSLPNPNIMLEQGFDPRFVVCQRPVIVSGGELTADMLDVYYDPDTRQYRSPLQLKANNGIFIIDDMGRQRVAPETVFNRWIVPLEEKRDFLSLGAGQHFSVPFDVVLVFSTNLNPTDLADEAFLRRIGYKIEFQHLTPDEYSRIWTQVCAEQNITCDADVLGHVINELHQRHGTPLAPCHPRDLLSIAVDHSAYQGQPRHVTREHMDWAWKNYFVSLRPGEHAPRATAIDGGR